MKSKHYLLKEDVIDANKKYFLCMEEGRKSSSKKLNSPSKSRKKIKELSPKKSIPSKKSI